MPDWSYMIVAWRHHWLGDGESAVIRTGLDWTGLDWTGLDWPFVQSAPQAYNYK